MRFGRLFRLMENLMGEISINGVSVASARTISIKNGRVIVDGKDVTPDGKEINISVTGNIDRIDADACERITISGDVGNVKTMSGDVDVTGAVSGSVNTMSGDVHCGGPIHGSASSMSGDIRSR